MKILLTGHKGFIGSHYHNLIEKNNEVFAVDKILGEDLCDRSITKNLPDVDVVIHMAATNGTKLFYEIPTEVSFNNTIPTFNIFERYKGTNTKFLFTSTF